VIGPRAQDSSEACRTPLFLTSPREGEHPRSGDTHDPIQSEEAPAQTNATRDPTPDPDNQHDADPEGVIQEGDKKYKLLQLALSNFRHEYIHYSAATSQARAWDAALTSAREQVTLAKQQIGAAKAGYHYACKTMKLAALNMSFIIRQGGMLPPLVTLDYPYQHPNFEEEWRWHYDQLTQGEFPTGWPLADDEWDARFEDEGAPAPIIVDVEMSDNDKYYDGEEGGNVDPSTRE